jgi:ribosome-associated protein
MSPEQIVTLAVKALDAKSAKDIRVLHISEKTVLADYFIICNGTSSAHVKALVDEVDRQLSEAGESVRKREGQRSDIWVLMDFGCVVVHVFTDEGRKFYNLERLWMDSEEVPLSSLLSP